MQAIQITKTRSKTANQNNRLFAVAYTNEVCMSTDTTSLCFDQSKMKGHLFNRPEQQAEPFPQISDRVRS